MTFHLCDISPLALRPVQQREKPAGLLGQQRAGTCCQPSFHGLRARNLVAAFQQSGEGRDVAAALRGVVKQPELALTERGWRASVGFFHGGIEGDAPQDCP